MTRCQSDGAPSNCKSKRMREHLRPPGRVSEGGGVSLRHSRRLSYLLDRRSATRLDVHPSTGSSVSGSSSTVGELTTWTVPHPTRALQVGLCRAPRRRVVMATRSHRYGASRKSRATSLATSFEVGDAAHRVSISNIQSRVPESTRGRSVPIEAAARDMA